MDRSRKLLVLACCIVAGATGGTTLAAFSAQTSSAGNTFSAAASFGPTFAMSSGTYGGNGVDNRTITGIGFQPDVVIVKAATNQVGVMRTSTMTGDLAKPLVGAASLAANLIQSLDSDGFSIGTDNKVNSGGTTYYWTAFKAGAETLKVGSYTGNGTSQSLTGFGFSPEYVAVMSAAGRDAVNRFAGMTNTFDFEDDKGAADRITSLDADGFSVGANDRANRSGEVYHYVAFNEVAGAIDTGTYTGNATDNRDVTGVGFKPDYLIVRANDTANSRKQNHKPLAQLGGKASFFRSEAEYLTGIKALQTEGFKLGTDGSVNASGVTYHYLALNHTAGGCPLSGTQTLPASDDSFTEENNVTKTHGGEPNFKVKSKATAQNRRGFVRFSLPTIPSGCTFTGALLRLNARTVDGARTLALYRNAASWSEATLTWSNQPAAVGTPITQAVPASPSWMEWDVTDMVQAMMADGNYGFQLRDSVEDAAGDFEQAFDSREAGSNNPQLRFTLE